MRELLDEGTRRSTTFRALVGTIDGSDAIVYVQYGYCLFGHVNGCLLPVIAAQRGNRYLRIIIIRDKNRLSHDRLLALIGHELRHAVEVIDDANVVDLATMSAMYGRIGFPLAARMGFETSAAREAGYSVFSELSVKDRSR